MSEFFKKTISEDTRRFGPSGRFVGLAAFGKHPGWDDHVEDLGLETESLNLAKTVLYVNGIGGQIDSGAWEKLDAAQQLPAFNHVFVWLRSGQILIGRLWSSSDGKGRKRYPMVVCLHFAGVTLGWALKQALSALAELEAGCAGTTSAEVVRDLLNRKRAALREAIQSTDGRGEYAPVSPEALNRILQPAGGANPEGFLRVLYQLQSQLGAFAAGKFNARANPGTLRAQQIRVPAVGEGPEKTLLFWTRFFLTQVDPAVPLLLTLPLEADWVDVTAGDPESHEFFCLRASPKAVPMVSEVPYKLDDVFRAKAKAFLAGFQRGETTAADLQPAAVPELHAPAPARRGWFKWFIVCVLVGVAAVATVLLLPKAGQPQAKVSPPNAAAEAAKPPSVSTSTPAAPGPAKAESVRAQEQKDAAAEAARLAEEKKKSEALAAAAKLKADAEAAAKERDRQNLETARLAREKEAAAQKELQERQAAEAAAAKKKADEEAKAKMELAAAAVTKTADAVVASPTATSREMTNSFGMVFVLVPSPSEVWVGKYEVTRAEYRSVLGLSTPIKPSDERRPMANVTWTAANRFCLKLTEKERSNLPAGKSYSLPTEKQWQAFAAGQKFDDLPGKGVKGEPSVVGQSAPANQFGLYDVLGNVWEWCLDGAAGELKLLKGGAFDSAEFSLNLPADTQKPDCGFRCVLVAQ
jgi:formylglycine-generating enzyme required for sulfatase activity